ncbi:alpha/beta fold hydrolase [Streptomyces sp. NPDC057307]|uniref:alpha/beta fold hydrolase n=1 Tax=Streptomyces sp. NPDC057307 TaxID=3346096 RepID=UPI00364257FB
MPLHIHDHGGEGPPLLLLHGAGRSLADWDAAVPLLTPYHRVLAADLPAHGRSDGDTPWTFDAAVAAIEEALSAYDVPDAILVGHSLGGMLAAEYADRHPGVTPGVVNLDGLWWEPVESYTGEDRESRERFGEMTRAAGGQVAPPDYVEQQVAYADRFGIPAARAEASARASARELSDGGWQLLPVRDRWLELMDALDGLDPLPTMRRLRCPLLVVVARGPQPPMPGMEWFERLTATHVRRMNAELAALVNARPTAATADVDATHAMLLEEPEAVAELVLAFTRTAGTPAS